LIRKTYFLITIIIVLIIGNSFISLGDKRAEFNGTINLTNDNGDITAGLSNTITVTFNDPVIDTSASSGGGGGGFDKSNYSSEEKEEAIENLEELLNTVSAKELGYEFLDNDRKKADLITTFVTAGKPESDVLELWPGFSDSDNNKNYINGIISSLTSDELSLISSSHESELFEVKTIYSNQDAYVNRTRVKIIITPNKNLNNIRILEFIPKSVVVSASSLIFINDIPEVLDDDPLLEWKIDNLNAGESKIISYYIKGRPLISDIKTLIVTDKIENAEQITGDAVIDSEKNYTTSDDDWRAGSDDDSSFSIWPFLIIILFVGLIAGSVFYKKQIAQIAKIIIKPKIGNADLILRKDLIIPYNKVKKIEKYIESQVRLGKSDSEIRNELINVGWNSYLVDVVMHDIHIIDDNLNKLDKFIHSSLDKGMVLDDIKKILMNIGWREDVVDLAIDDFKGV